MMYLCWQRKQKPHQLFFCRQSTSIRAIDLAVQHTADEYWNVVCTEVGYDFNWMLCIAYCRWILVCRVSKAVCTPPSYCSYQLPPIGIHKMITTTAFLTDWFAHKKDMLAMAVLTKSRHKFHIFFNLSSGTEDLPRLWLWNGMFCFVDAMFCVVERMSWMSRMFRIECFERMAWGWQPLHLQLHFHPAGDPAHVWPDRFLFSCLFNTFDEEHKQHCNHQALPEHLVMSIKFINSLYPEDNLPLLGRFRITLFIKSGVWHCVEKGLYLGTGSL